MKHLLKFIAIVAIVGVIFTGCKPDEPKVTIVPAFSFSPENPLAGEEVVFTNATQGGGTTYAWVFGDAGVSTDKDPVFTFETDGTYEVALTIDGNAALVTTKTVTVGAQTPTYTTDMATVQIAEAVKFTPAVYAPEGATVTWKWEFPIGKVVNAEGMTDIDEATGVSTITEPSVIFVMPEEANGYEIKLTATIDGAEYVGTYYLIVKNQLAKTLFMAVKGGNINVAKLFGTGAQVADLGVPAGSHPLTIQYANDRLYVFDAGSTLGYSADAQETAGSIVSYAGDGTSYMAHIAEFGGHNYGDAFFGYVNSEYIYFTDRNNDVTRIGVTDENLDWVTDSGTANPDNAPAFVANSGLAYYGAEPGYGWGALNGGFMEYNDMFWWAKNSNHKGLWRFVESDIASGVIPTAGGILTGRTVRTFAIDEVNSKIYFSSNKAVGDYAIGFFVADIDGENVVEIDLSQADGEGGGNEYAFITGIVIDNDAGYVYWAYRGPVEVADGEGGFVPVDYDANPLLRSGIKQYKLDGSGVVEYLIKDIEVYGLTVDHTLN